MLLANSIWVYRWCFEVAGNFLIICSKMLNLNGRGGVRQEASHTSHDLNHSQVDCLFFFFSVKLDNLFLTFS